jgi:hypothetical protein
MLTEVFILEVSAKDRNTTGHLDTQEKIAFTTYDRALKYAIEEYSLNHSCSQMLEQDTFLSMESRTRELFFDINKLILLGGL